MPPRLPTRSKNINYLSKDFYAYKEDLQEHLKRYFPDTIQDFNDTSGGMAILDLIAYMGDALSFQLDRNINEAFLSRTNERKNVIAIAEQYGYLAKGPTPSTAIVDISARFPKTIQDSIFFTVQSGTRVSSSTQPANFELVDNVNFASEKNRTVIEETDDFITYSITGAKVIAGRTKLFDYQVPTSPAQFLGVTLPDRGVTEIRSVVDNFGTSFTEVPNLAVDTVFYGDPNASSNTDDIDYTLKLKKVPNRFTSERNPDGTITIRFGTGDSALSDGDFIPNPSDFVTPAKLRGDVDGFVPEAIDPADILKTKSLGNLPKSNSVLSIYYRVGGGLDTNVGANLINVFVDRKIAFNNPNAESTYGDETKTALSTLKINNPAAAFGGEDSESVNSIRENATNYLNSQLRCVTLSDYKVRALSMPPSFGRPFRVVAMKDPYKDSGVNISILSRNSAGTLIRSSDVLKNNLERYMKRFKGIGESIRFSDGNIVNIGVNFTLYPTAGANAESALLKAMFVIRDYFDITKLDFGSTISKSDLIRVIQNIPEVAAIPLFEIVNLTGFFDNRLYSTYSINIQSITKNNIIYFPADAIPELKFANFDIQGSLA